MPLETMDNIRLIKMIAISNAKFRNFWGRDACANNAKPNFKEWQLPRSILPLYSCVRGHEN